MADGQQAVTSGGLSFPFVRSGSGQPVLFLHGIVGEFGPLPFLDALARHYTVFAPLQPGFDGPHRLDRIDTVDDLVFNYVDLLDHWRLEAPIVVGASTGGWLAAELAIHHPSRVGRLVLIDPTGLYRKDATRADIFAASFTASRYLLFAEPESDLARRYLPDQPAGEALDRILNSRQAIARIGWNPYLYDPKLKERLYRISAPSLVVWGEGDRLIGPEHAGDYLAGIAVAKAEVVSAGGHLPHIESPDRVAEIVHRFLGSGNGKVRS